LLLRQRFFININQTHLHTLPVLRMSGTLPLLPPTRLRILDREKFKLVTIAILLLSKTQQYQPPNYKHVKT